VKVAKNQQREEEREKSPRLKANRKSRERREGEKLDAAAPPVLAVPRSNSLLQGKERPDIPEEKNSLTGRSTEKTVVPKWREGTVPPRQQKIKHSLNSAPKVQ